jgi:hypothetical protein
LPRAQTNQEGNKVGGLMVQPLHQQQCCFMDCLQAKLAALALEQQQKKLMKPAL